MTNQLFYLENKEELSINSFKNLRRLYLPLIGVNSLVLYELLHDLSKNDYKNLFNSKDIINLMQIELSEFASSLINLEAIGLIKKYIKNDSSCFILSLKPPLSVFKFHKNSLLKNHLIKKIGIKEYESIYYGSIQKNINKVDFIDVSKKYQDVFVLDFENHIKGENENNQYSTLDLTIASFDTHEENIKKLPSSHFIKYISKRNPTFNENLMISSLLKLGYADSSINLLIDFSIKYNERIVTQYIITIANDFHSRSITSFLDVENELILVDSIKKNALNKKLDLFTFKDEIKESNNIKKVAGKKKVSIENIFSIEDMKEMF